MILLNIDESAPDFSLPGSDHNEYKLSDYKGKKVVLYFYPKDNALGCRTEACDFRDSFANIQCLNAFALGVSRDSLVSHDKFITTLGLPFVLLSDTTEEVCKLYDVISVDSPSCSYSVCTDSIKVPDKES